MPGVTLDEVVENTGFDVGINDSEIPTYDPINEAELEILRTTVNEKVKQIYPAFAKQMWG